MVGVANADTVGYWSFEEGIADANATGAGTILDGSGNGLNLTPINSPVYSSRVPFEPGSSNRRGRQPVNALRGGKKRLPKSLIIPSSI